MLVFNRARSFVTLVTLVAVLMTAGLTFAPPARASDMSGPGLASSSVEATNLNHRLGSVTINTTIRLVDETGVQSPTIIATWVDPDPWGWVYHGIQSQGFGGMELVSGTNKDGIWKHSMTIPRGAALGQWEVKLYPLSDTWGNRSSSFRTLDVVTVIDEKPPTPVTPAAVTFTDKDGTAADTYTVPKMTGVDYWIGNKVVAAGTYPGTGSVTVTTKARNRYVLAPGAASSWTTTFKGLLVGAVPKITGTAKVGSTLTANRGTWVPTPSKFRYQWYRSGVAIIGATSAKRKLTTLDAGKTLTVKVTGSRARHTTAVMTSAPTAAVAEGSLVSSTPTITGTAKVGSTLTANRGTWVPTPSKFRYQWYRSGVAIIGATSAKRKLTTLDAGKTLTVKVTGSKVGYATAFETSRATARITK